MSRIWNPELAPFGDAMGLDYVALDVKRVIAERFGATVLVGALPADIAADQPQRLKAIKNTYGDRYRDRDDTFAALTISQDGLTVSGEHRDGNGHTSGSIWHYWSSQVGQDTVVFDLRTVPDDLIVSYAVRGPMLDVTLPPGHRSGLPIDALEGSLRQIADNYLRPYGGVTATGYRDRTSVD